MKHTLQRGIRWFITWIFLLNLLPGSLFAAGPQNTTFHLANEPATGLSYKMRIEADGLYQLTYNDLQNAGIPVDSVDPRTFKVWVQGEEIAIYVTGESDGHFDPGDGIYFYAEMARTKYQDPNVYWLTYGGNPGQRMSTRDVTPGSASPPSPYKRTLHLEEDRDYRRSLPMEENADHWYWESYFACSSIYCFPDDVKTYTFELPNLATGSFTALLRPRLRGLTAYSPNPDHHVIFYINGTQVGEGFWDGTDELTDEYTFAQSLLIAGTNTISYYVPLDLPGVPEERGLTNWFEVEYYDVYEAEDDHLWFSIDETGTWKPTITHMESSDFLLLDLSDKNHPVRLLNASVDGSGSDFSVTFQDVVDSAPRPYFIAGRSAYLTPASIERDNPSNLRDPNNQADWIVITHRDFWTQAFTLADHRASFSGLRTMVVDVQDVYDEFSGGLMDPEAIRSFLAYAHEHWQRPAPQYVLLFGDGNYDYKNLLFHPEKEFIPPYLDLVDCFLGETAADNRFVAGERTNADPNALECQRHAMPFMAIGRFPVNSVQEAEGMVKKTICYENPSDPMCSDINPPDGWETKAVFVADKNDNAGAFTCHSDEVAGQQRCPNQDFGFKPTAAGRRPQARVAVRSAASPLAVLSPQVTTRKGFIGDYIWLDSDKDGWPDDSESGIDGVVVNLWEDVDHDGTLSAPDQRVATVTSGDNPNTTTVEHGWYGFDGLEKTDYLVEIDPSNFQSGGALEGLELSSGQNPWPVHMDGVIPDEYTRDKLYLQDEASPGYVPYRYGNDVKNALLNAINAGAAFVTYNGHASTWKWSGADVWDIYAMSNLTNTDAWPIFLPMTCLEAQFQVINGSAVSESVVRALDDDGNPVGGVAAWGPTGLGVATGHTYLYTGFFEALFHKGITRIGDTILYAKKKLYESDTPFKDLLETYTLFGDPALEIQIPKPDLHVTKEVAPTASVQPGDTITYTLKVVNEGEATAYSVRITDTLPAELTPVRVSTSGVPVTQESGTQYVWQTAEIPAGDEVTITVVAQVRDNVSPGTTVANTVRATTTSAEDDLNDNQATVLTSVGDTYAISGVTFMDSNANRTLDADEEGMEGLTLTLSDENGTIATTTSDASGHYTFTDVLPGTYTVTVTPPAGYVPTTPTARAVTVSDAPVSDVNFGFISPTSVTLTTFEAASHGRGVRIDWAVWDERNVVAYRLWRGKEDRLEKAQPISQWLPARGTAGVSRYSYTDTPPSGGLWYYWIAIQDKEGNLSWAGPVAARYLSHRLLVPFLVH